MPQQGLILLVEDDRSVRLATQQTLELEGFDVRPFEDAERALKQLPQCPAAIVVSDVKMPGMDGLDLLRETLRLDGEIPVVLITGHGDISMAVQAIKLGAYDFLEKPFLNEILVSTATRALERRRIVLENRALRSELAARDNHDETLLGNSDSMVKLRNTLGRIAPAPVDVLLWGETGSGKEVAARKLHRLSDRRDRPFVALNCGGLPENLIESELFGHTAGAFTGAQKARTGRIQYADRGTLFLDEIESMPLAIQVKLLRVLQDRKVLPLGSNVEEAVDMRVIAATKIDLAEAVSRGAFREDLYWRLNVVTVRLPPLRQRMDDVPLLFQHFAYRAALRLGQQPPHLTPDMLQALMSHAWPGNVRELRNAAERHVLGVDVQLPSRSGTHLPRSTVPSLEEQVNEFERTVIQRELARQHGSIKATMDSLGLPRKTLTDKMRRLGLSRDDYTD
jgi:two-component system C4-dicarboxylate transport response regulator DctD